MHPLQLSLLHSHQDQREISSSESVILYSALEICGAQSERKKTENVSGGSLALTHLSALVFSYLSSHLHLFSTNQAPLGLTPRFHSSLLHSHLFILALWPPVFIIPLSTFYLSILSPDFPAKRSPCTSEVCTCHSSSAAD